MIKDFFIISLNNLLRRRLRSWLTILGIFVGIAAVVALIALSQGMKDAVNVQFEQIGKTRIMIVPGGTFFGPLSSSAAASTLSEKEIDIVRNVPGVEFARGVIAKTVQVKYKDQTTVLSMWGMPIDSEAVKYYEALGIMDIGTGRNFKPNDKYKTVVGYNIAEDSFESPIEPGRTVLINNIEFGVIGTQAKSGTGVHNQMVRIPFKTAKEMFNTGDTIDLIFGKVSEKEDLNTVVEKIKKELRKYRGVKENKEDFSIQTSAQTIQQINQLLKVIQAVLVGIAAISLLVGGIGIMNTMYTSVLERTKEVGILKSLGARNSAVMYLFLIESGLLGFVGGVMGVIIGMLLGKTAELAARSFDVTLTPNYSFVLIAGALLFSFSVGALSGVLPAYQASKLHPVDALRKKK
ncbi:ABC transporter permease [Candidatus Woesearchaeota archaeon]|jgi:putative ABC transport system permease protein|nr:ABC transporter permease [Candidatus Woesearchaeota archaeon]